MNDKLKKFQSIVQSPSDFLLLCRIAAWIMITPIMLRLLPLPSVMAIFTPRHSSNSKGLDETSPPEYQEKVIQYTMLLLGRERAMFRRNCLKRCLVTYRFLRLSGKPVVFFLGVRKDDGRLAGHSWLEINSRPVFKEQESYRITYSYPDKDLK